jgi:hypothetical protein
MIDRYMRNTTICDRRCFGGLVLVVGLFVEISTFLLLLYTYDILTLSTD